MKVLVTGAAGFIGGQLMHALWKNGHTAIGVDNYSYGSADNLHFDDHDFSADVIKMDIRDKEEIDAVAIGGLKANHVKEIFKAGADGVAVISAICGQKDPNVAAQTLFKECPDTRLTR